MWRYHDWSTNLFNSYAYENEPTFGHELNLDFKVGWI